MENILRTLTNLFKLFNNLDKNSLINQINDFNHSIINYQNDAGETPLHYAAMNNDLNLMKLLLSHPNINVNIKNKSCQTPIFFVRSKEALQLLLKHPFVDINTKNLDGNTLLHVTDNKNMIKILLGDRRIDPNISNLEGDSALFTENVEKIKILLDFPRVNVNHQDHNGFALLHKTENKEIINILLNQYNIDVNRQDNNGFSPIFYASYDKLQLLLKNKKINVNIQNNNGNTFLHCCNDIPNIKEILQHSNIDVNILNHNDEPPYISLNMEKNHLIIDKGLIHYKNYILHRNIHPEIYSRLIQICDVNFKNENGETPLHVITDRTLVRMLVEHPLINVNAQDDNGDTPLHVLDNIEKLKILLGSININIEIENNEGKKPIDVYIGMNYEGLAACIESFSLIA